MIDVPPEPSVPVIERRLVDCGLSRDGFTVKYEDYLQSIEIVISPAAGATEDRFACIREAAGYEIVTFADGATQRAYSDFVLELLRPQMLEEASSELKQRGLLVGFPERASFASADHYAEAIETHCGFPPGSALQPDGDRIVFNPPDIGSEGFQKFSEKYGCVFAAMKFAIAKGDFKAFGFYGNEKFRESEGE